MEPSTLLSLQQELSKFKHLPDFERIVQHHYRLMTLGLSILERAHQPDIEPPGVLLDPFIAVDSDAVNHLIAADPTVDPLVDGILCVDRFGSTRDANQVATALFNKIGYGTEWPTKKDFTLVVPEDIPRVDRFFCKDVGTDREDITFACLSGHRYTVTRFQVGQGNLYVSRDPLKKAG